jgi:hypothetical protein
MLWKSLLSSVRLRRRDAPAPTPQPRNPAYLLFVALCVMCPVPLRGGRPATPARSTLDVPTPSDARPACTADLIAQI